MSCVNLRVVLTGEDASMTASLLQASLQLQQRAQKFSSTDALASTSTDDCIVRGQKGWKRNLS
jgi:hypothetical protein